MFKRYLSYVSVTSIYQWKSFNINCPDEEKENVIALADYVNEKINLVAPKCKAMSESSLLSFTLLAIADEIFTKKEKNL